MDLKHLEIIEKAALLFLRNGIKSVTMDDLAKELGVSKKTIYKYFEDKNDLVTKIVKTKTTFDRHACESARCESENAIDAMFRISEFVSGMMQEVHSSVFFDLQKYHREAWKIMEDHKSNFVKSQLKENIIRGQNEGLYISSLDPEVIASIYIASTNGLFDGETFDLKLHKFNEIFNEIIHFQIRGIANEKGLKYLNNRIQNSKK
ncbi:MAG: TetR/AcrR family transcriptional regulator [Brumimicrobium sp.]|nr:TetR/AcrR family transcriptional regulator [Brumimicrobium sp.]